MPSSDERYWLEPDLSGNQAAVGQLAAEHPLLGAAVRLAGAEGWLLTGRLSLTDPSVARRPRDRRGGGACPATAFVELALAAARAGRRGGARGSDARRAAGAGRRGRGQRAGRVAAPDEDGRRPIEIYGAVPPRHEERSATWRLHADRALARAPRGRGIGCPPAWRRWPPADAQEVDVEDFYATLADADYCYGPTFQGLRAAWRDGDEWLAEVALPEARHGDAAAFRTHPALPDAALHTVLLAALDRGRSSQPAVPFSFAGVRLHAPGAAALRVRVDLSTRRAAACGSPPPTRSVSPC